MTPTSFTIQILVNGVVLSLGYILVALGLTLIFGILDVVNFAHGEFYMLGGVIVYYIYSQAEANYFLVLALAIVVTAGLGFLVEKLIFYPVRKEALVGFIVALGLVYVLQSSVYLSFGAEPRPVLTPYSDAFRVFGASVPHSKLLPSLASLVLAAAVIAFMRYSKQGRMLRAVAQDPDAASLQGISIARARSLCFVLGCGLAGAAGGLVAPLGFVHAYMGAEPLVKAFSIIIIGGLGSIPGAIIGGFFIGFLDSIGATFIGSGASLLLGFVVIFLVLLARPRGLFGHV